MKFKDEKENDQNAAISDSLFKSSSEPNIELDLSIKKKHKNDSLNLEVETEIKPT